MNNCFLSIPDRIFLEEARANTNDKVAYMKLSVLVMLDEGFTQEVISVSLGIGIGTVNKCKKKYDSDGGLCGGGVRRAVCGRACAGAGDRKSTRLNSSH